MYAKTTEETADLTGVQAFASYTLGNKEVYIKSIESMIGKSKDNCNVQYLGIILPVLKNRLEEVVEMLSKYEGILESYLVTCTNLT